MSRQALNATLWAAVLICLASESVAQSCQDKLETAQASVVELFVVGPTPSGTNMNKIFGSGFVIHSDDATKQTYIMTAAHIFNPDAGFADKLAGGEGKERTIRVRVQRPDNQFVVLSDDANLIIENVARDFAILAIPKQSIDALKTASSSRMTTGAFVCLAGFPESEHKYIGKALSVRTPDLPNSHIILEGIAEAGQSGGAVLDQVGRAVAIISANDSKPNARTHAAVIVSDPLDSLNEYLRKKGSPTIALEDANAAASHFKILERKGRVEIQLSGDSGELVAAKLAKAEFSEEVNLAIEAQGTEQSECAPVFNAAKSTGVGSATIQLFETNGLRMNLKALARGGRYMKSAACVLNNPVGLETVETTSSSIIRAEGNITFESVSVPFNLGLVWQAMPPFSEIALVNPLSQTQVELIDPSAAGEKIVKIDRLGKWQVKVKTAIQAKGVGTKNVELPARPVVYRAGPGCLNRISASISGASAGVRPPSGLAAG